MVFGAAENQQVTLGGFFRAVYVQFSHHISRETSHPKIAFASQEPEGRDLEIGNKVREPRGLERTTSRMVFAHGQEVPAVYAVFIGKGLETTKDTVSDKAVNGGEEAGDHGGVIVRHIHRHHQLMVHNSFPDAGRQNGILHRYFSFS